MKHKDIKGLNNMVDNSRVVLEDNIEYLVVDKIKEKDFYYIYLINHRDDADLVVRKEIVENDERFLVGLDDEDELERALTLFLDKNDEEK